LTGSDSGSITFRGTTGTLVLDHSSSFTGELINLTGDGNPTSSDQIDLKDIAFGSGTTDSYVGNSSGGILTISDSQGHTSNISLVGNYTNSTFTLSSDGQGGTIVIDPPKDGFNFATNPVPATTSTAPPVTADVRNDGFIFHQSVGGNSGNLDIIAHDAFVPNVEHSNLISLVNDAQLNHQWADAAHDATINHLGSPSLPNAYFAEHHSFMIH
jgi:hypothetical protein